jgi:hypothetical protein
MPPLPVADCDGFHQLHAPADGNWERTEEREEASGPGQSRYNPPMAEAEYEEDQEDLENSGGFTGFGLGTLQIGSKEDVYLLIVSRDGSLTAAAYATERAAMEAAVESLEDEQVEDEDRMLLEDRYARTQTFISDEGGVLEIIPSPVFGR